MKACSPQREPDVAEVVLESLERRTVERDEIGSGTTLDLRGRAAFPRR
jgi:hypothetical protein